jgi:hypothetical protein
VVLEIAAEPNTVALEIIRGESGYRGFQIVSQRVQCLASQVALYQRGKNPLTADSSVFV